MKKLMAFILSALMLMSFTACSKDTKENEGTETEPVSIRINAINAVNWAPVFIAEEEGFFDKYNLDVEFTTPGGPTGFQAMHAGDSQFCMLSQEPMLIAQEQGLESTIICTMLTTRLYGVIARGDIKSFEDLKGCTVYASNPSSAPYTFTTTVLSMNGIDPLNDVELIQMEDANAAVHALLNGSIDAAYINMSSLTAFEDFDYTLLADTTTEADREKYLGALDFPAEMLCTTTEYADSHPEICQAVVNAVLDAQAWIAEHSDAEVAEALAESFAGMEPDAIEAELSVVREYYSLDGMVTEEGEKAVIDMCVESDIISETIPWEDVVDMTFCENYGK